MRVRLAYCLALGFAGLLSGNLEQVLAAEDLSRNNNLHVTQPTSPRFPDDVFSRIFPGLLPFSPQTNEMREQAQELGMKGRIIDAKDNLNDFRQA